MEYFLSIFLNSELVILALQVYFGAFASFLAILLWPRAQNAAVTCFILGIFFLFINILYDTLQRLEILSPFSSALLTGFVIFMRIFPLIIFSVALILLLRKSKV